MKGVTTSLIPCTYPLEGCLMCHTYKSLPWEHQVPSHDFLDMLMAEQVALGQRSQHVIIDEFGDFSFLRILLERRLLNVGVHHHKVVFSLSSQGLFLVIPVSGCIAKEEPPSHASMFYLRHFYVRLGTPFHAYCFSFSISTTLLLNSRE